MKKAREADYRSGLRGRASTAECDYRASGLGALVNSFVFHGLTQTIPANLNIAVQNIELAVACIIELFIAFVFSLFTVK